MHLCLLAGLLQRQGPHHPRIPRHLSAVLWLPCLGMGWKRAVPPQGKKKKTITLKFSHLLFGSKTTYYLKGRGWV